MRREALCIRSMASSTERWRVLTLLRIIANSERITSHFLSIRASLDCLRFLVFLRLLITLAVLQGVTNNLENYSMREQKKGREINHDLGLWKSGVKQELTQSHYLRAYDMESCNYSRTLHRARLLDSIGIV